MRISNHGHKELFFHGEGKAFEFKRNLSSPKSLLKTLVAFANTAGRRLTVGVGDDRRLESRLESNLAGYAMSHRSLEISLVREIEN